MLTEQELRFFKLNDENLGFDSYCEQCIVYNCSPTLLGIKCASLFSIRFKSFEELNRTIWSLTNRYRKKGLEFNILNINKGLALVYVYRRKLLSKIISDDLVWEFLVQNDYQDRNIESVLKHLGNRIAVQNGFPHEIGCFLGYPLEDVKGFIENSGEDFLICGYWKVYSNPERAKNLFDAYDRCRCSCIEKFLIDKSINNLVVNM